MTPKETVLTIGPVLEWPIRAVWYLTERCNLNCPYCLNDSRPNGSLGMSTDQALAVANMLAIGGVALVALLGGEPLCHPGFAQISQRLADQGIGIHLVTNGLLLDDARLGTLLRLGRRLPSVQLSLHCHDRMDFYANLVRSLTREGVNVLTLVVLTQSDLSHVSDMYHIVAAAGAKSFVVAEVGERGRAAGGEYEGRIPGTVDLARLVIELTGLQRKHGYTTTPTFKHRGMVSGFLNKRFGLETMSNVCEAGLSEVQILPDGRCSPCYFLDEKDAPTYTTESLLSLGSLGRTWNGPEFQRFRRDKMHGDSSPVRPGCMVCEHHRSGRCRPCLIEPSGCVAELTSIRGELAPA